MLVKDVMTEDPFTIDPDALLGQAGDVMRGKDLRHLPVVDRAGRLIGIVAERDLRRAALAPAVEADRDASALRVKDVMSGDVLTTHPEAPLAHAARIMFERRVGSLPVVLDGRLLGMLTEQDVTRALARGRIGGQPDPEGVPE